ncbi:type I restriction enzyme endonuclease domain-containing protein [Polymorphospora rubra]
MHQRFRDSAGRLERFYRLCATSRDFVERAGDIQRLRRDIHYFRDVRVWVVKEEAADREAKGRPTRPRWNATCPSSPPKWSTRPTSPTSTRRRARHHRAQRSGVAALAELGDPASGRLGAAPADRAEDA